MAFEGFPTEILLKIVEQLPLSALLIFRGVSRQWQIIIDDPTLDIPQERRDLYNLYMGCINTPVFIESRSWIPKFLTPFDRQSYIDAIYQQTNFIPALFRLFILEWPDMAAIPHFWPGLPMFYSLEEGVHARTCNLLARQPPKVSVATYCHDDIHRTRTDVPCLILCLGIDHMPLMTLSLDEGSNAEGRVFLNTLGELILWDTEEQIGDEGELFENWVHFMQDFGLGWLRDGTLWLKGYGPVRQRHVDNLGDYDWVTFCSHNLATTQTLVRSAIVHIPCTVVFCLLTYVQSRASAFNVPWNVYALLLGFWVHYSHSTNYAVEKISLQ